MALSIDYKKERDAKAGEDYRSQEERERISARRRAAAARRARLSRGQHEEKWARLREKMEEERGSSRKHPAGRRRGKTGTSQVAFRMGKVCLLALCITGVLCFSPLPGLFHAAGDQVNASALAGDVVYEVIEVKEGDTLWSIAGEYFRPEYQSIPAFIEEIKECNHMENDQIYAGSYLMVPGKEIVNGSHPQ